jgi:hypothetical protein
VLTPADKQAEHEWAFQAFQWLWDWGLIRTFHPASFHSAAAWWEHLRKSEAGRLRTQYQQRDKALANDSIRYVNDVERLTKLLKTGDWQSADARDIVPGCRRRAAAAWCSWARTHYANPQALWDHVTSSALEWAVTSQFNNPDGKTD